MSWTVFVSHSLAWGDDLLVAQMCEQLRKHHGVDCRMARRTWKVGPSVIGELEDDIGSADCVLALIMNDGTALSYVNQELGIAVARKKPVIGVAERSAYLGPLLAKVPDFVVVSLDAPHECASDLHSRLSTLNV